MKLYEITDNMRELQAMADSGELSAEDIADTLEALEGEFDVKAEAALKVRQSMLGEVAAIEKEIERLTDLKKAPENSAVRLGDYIKGNMLALDKDKIDLGIFKLTLKKPTIQLGNIDESKIPDEYFKIIPESKKLDKRTLLEYAKLKTIPGVELGESKRALIIK